MKFNKALLVSGFGLAGAALYLLYLKRRQTEVTNSTTELEKPPIVGPTEPSFECPICYEDRCLTCVPKCGHAICNSCVRDVLVKGVNDKCGFCREPLSRDQRQYTATFRVPPADVTQEDLNFALQAAVRENNFDFVRFYIEAGAEVNSDPYGGGSCLFIAVAQDSEKMFELLVEYGGDLTCKDIHDRNLLHCAARTGSMSMLKKLAQAGLPVNSKISSGEAPIHSAVSSGSLDAVQFLYGEGANLNDSTQGHVTPLAVAAEKGLPDVVKFLLENGANVIPELNAVELAARNSVDCLKVFAEAGVSLEVESGMSPLMSACASRRMDTIKFLLCQGLNPNYAAPNGNTASSVAAFENWTEGLKVLQAHGANLNVKNIIGANVVNMAAISRSYEALVYLVEQGCDVNGRFKPRPGIDLWETSLAGVLTYERYDLAEMLLRAGADPDANLGTLDHETVLIRSIYHKQPEAVRLLLKYGATFDLPDSHGFQAIQYAKRVEDPEIVEILKNAGADAYLPEATRDGISSTLPEFLATLLQQQAG